MLFFVIIGVAGTAFLLHHYSQDLPDYEALAHYEPPTVTRVHAGDGRLLAEYATERRVFVPIDAMPKRVINAFLSAEDKNFYTHPGIDIQGIARAAIQNIAAIGSNRRPVGASTITQQVAKNFLLTNEVSIDRKVKEAILAFRIEKAFSKDRILELYLNEIFLGYRSYGVTAAALNYFNKSPDDLTIAEVAYLAALPKAPNNYHPVRQREAALGRRNWVIDRMLENGFITQAEAEQAAAEPLLIRRRDPEEFITADYVAEEVRRELVQRFGEGPTYGGGLSVRTSLDPRLQQIADRALRDGLVAYDRRHGWRGPLAQISVEGDWMSALAKIAPPAGLSPWRMAVVLEVKPDEVVIGLSDGDHSVVPFADMRWARRWLEDQRFGAEPRRPADVVAVGDVVPVEAKAEKDGTVKAYALRQIPDVEGGLIALDPHTGRVLAMTGGWSFQESQFNRVTQAIRQPGSSFKPFVYMAALDSGFTPASVILDGPLVIDQGPGLPKWKPSNYSNEFYGPSPLRVGIEKSRNLMTVRLAEMVGMPKVVDYAQRFGVIDNMMPVLSMSLGAGETTLLKMAAGYAMIVNGGKRIQPHIIDQVQDRIGNTLYRFDERPCDSCANQPWVDQAVPVIPDIREDVVEPVTAYQMTSMLQGVVQRGTGRSIAELGRPLAGKTGTTNDSFDTWFMGFSPDMVVGVFVGFDQPRTLGARETGSSAAAPIFKDFMAEALKDQPIVPFRVPSGVQFVRINGATGQLAGGGAPGYTILEAFRPGTEPERGQPSVQPFYGATSTGGASDGETPPVATGLGGLY
ncbi:MAG: penicillin-binding protein 1A [Alphaproteobacteria bacterium]|nr:penicillin-binding protein 1A [Alphaproteobacteria bacterium]MBU0796539.1 penicillin-binding protein 1A [Alphaproteobacteria bacterium]MBU0888291.1 penicillin-binding protein 1A [Alphaproteobacteria bacterium]MBU1811492.1 penicillin-binding protein 1A [Alphaproteobacteria bacterium]